MVSWEAGTSVPGIRAGNPMRDMHYFCMLKRLLALLLLATPAFAQERPTAYQALRTVGTQLNRDFVNHVILVSGSNGDPQPETWRILLDDPKAGGGVRELEVSNGKIVSERTPLRSPVEGSLGPTIDTAKLNLDSSGAYTLARQTADKSHITFATADYTLRVDKRGNPIWIIALQKQDGEAAGKIYIGANHGRNTRNEGIFSGGDGTGVVDEQTDQSNSDDGDANDDGTVPGRIKHAFRQAGDDVKQTFFKVRRSFVDFFQDK